MTRPLGMAFHGALLALLALIPAKVTSGAIACREVPPDARPLVMLERPFEFGPRGGISFELTGLALRLLGAPNSSDSTFLTDAAALARMGVVAVPERREAFSCPFYASRPPGCPLASAGVSVLFRFDIPEIARQVSGQDPGVGFRTTVSAPDGEHALYFANCAAGTEASFRVTVSEFNGREGGGVRYLSAGDAGSPELFMVSRMRPGRCHS
ncbi:unnamed protein product [Ostreobium quekettii]|uniref:Uncharacterized protein n=2 Tax=Ostreobium quekettii TaxID=121088 RepID=A0A8S1J699_9CHLO|nr:unnamed protein product [Ostreobium quekettii]